MARRTLGLTGCTIPLGLALLFLSQTPAAGAPRSDVSLAANSHTISLIVSLIHFCEFFAKNLPDL